MKIQTSKSLSELLKEEHTLLEAIVENEGEILPDLEKTLKENKDLLSSKVESYSMLIDRLDKETELFKAKEDEFKFARQSLEKTRKRIWESLKEAMRFNDMEELRGQTVRLRLKRSQPIIEILEGCEFSASDLKRFYDSGAAWVKAKYEIDKAALKQSFTALSEPLQDRFKLIETYTLNRYPNVKEIKNANSTPIGIVPVDHG